LRCLTFVMLGTAACLAGAMSELQGAPRQSRSAAEAIAATERAFAAQALVEGLGTGFRANVADDAVALEPDPTTGEFHVISAKAKVFARPAPHRPSNIHWWPAFAGASGAGDLGFTTGPVIFGEKGYGLVFTVWAKQSDGRWKYYFDGGPGTEAKTDLKPEDPTQFLSMTPRRGGNAAKARREVAVVEAKLAAAAVTDTRRAYEPYLANSTRILGSPKGPAIGTKAGIAALAERPTAIRFETLGARSASSGDLVFTYGQASWQGTHAGFARIWYWTARGWRLAFDEIVEPPPKAG